MLNVRRDHVLEDTLRKISNPKLNFKLPLEVPSLHSPQVKFQNELGKDAGGLRKEYF